MKKCKIKSIRYLGKQKTYSVSMKGDQHNYAIHGVEKTDNYLISLNSHATAYTVTSSRQLWQKANYPLEFYTAALRSLKTADDRIPIYIRDAKKRDIFVNKLDLNKSKTNFEIVDNEIYYGFGKVLGIGDEIAERIVKLQPYTGIEDFVNRFGVEAKIVQPLIALKLFTEKDPYTTYLYYAAFRKALKAERDREQRHKNSIESYLNELSQLTGEQWEHGYDDNHFGKLRSFLDDDQWLRLCKYKKKYDRCMEAFEKFSKKVKISLETFDYKTLKLDQLGFKMYKAMKPLLKDPESTDAEIAYYGFPWRNEFELCERYRGFTFEDYEIDIVKCDPGKPLPVEAKIISVDYVTSKSGKMQYWKLRVVDAIDPTQKTVTVWEHDYDRFSNVLQPDNIVRMSLLPPEPPYPNYSLEGVKPWERRRKNPYGEDPNLDVRVVLLGSSTKKKFVMEEEDDSYLRRPVVKRKKKKKNE